MKLKDEAETRLAWLHLMCWHCWFNVPGNQVHDERGRKLLKVALPQHKYRVSNDFVVACCTCMAPTIHGVRFEEDPDGGIFCDHADEGDLCKIPKFVRSGRSIGEG